MSLTVQFLEEVEAFLAATGMDPTRLGRESLNDPKFVHQVRAGRAASTKTVDRVRQYMRDHSDKVAAAVPSDTRAVVHQ